MKYTVRVGNATKVVEALRFYCEGGFVIFANHHAAPYGAGLGMGHVAAPVPAPVAAFPTGMVDSIESAAVTTQKVPAAKKAVVRRG